MNFKAIAVAALTAASTLIPTAAEARSNLDHHAALWDAAASVGITVKLNTAECGTSKAYGWYYTRGRELVICQESSMRTGRWTGQNTGWSEEDLDTLRHEAHHLVQDCRDGFLNGDLDQVYRNPVQLAKEVMGNEGIRNVVKAYASASDHVKLMEVEAFTVAAMNDPLEQVRDIRTYCF